MSDFEFVFALYSLLLGLSMVELLGGLGRALEARFAAEESREKFAIGWLTPLLAIFVMLDLLSFWQAAWTLRNTIAVSGTALMAVAGFASLYFLAARLVFPSNPDGFTDLDTHYYRVRRVVLGLLFVLLAVQLAYYLTNPLLAAAFGHTRIWVMTLILAVLLVVAMWVKDKRANIVVLSLLVLRYVISYLL